MHKLSNQADKFELGEEKIYLNGAFMSPQLRSITEIGIDAIKKKASPSQITAADFFNDSEVIRTEFSKLINNNQPQRIVLIPSVSYGMANVVRNIEVTNKKIIVAGEQFPSNVYPWLSLANEYSGELAIIEPPDTLDRRGQKWNESILKSIDKRTALVALSMVHWADGTIFDLEAIRHRTSEVGALLIIDGTQSVGAMPFDIQQIKPDALICAGYKWLLGPYGIGMAYYGERFDSGQPIEENWINRLHSEDFGGLVEYEEAYQPGALRYEVGEHSNFILVPMMLEALRQLNEWSPQRIQEYCRELVAAPIEQLRDHGFWIEEEEYRASHLFGIRHDSIRIDQIKQLLDKNNIAVSYRGNSVRVAPYVHNTPDQLNKLVESLIAALVYV